MISAPSFASAAHFGESGCRERPVIEENLDLKSGLVRRSSAIKKPVWPSIAVMQMLRSLDIVLLILGFEGRTDKGDEVLDVLIWVDICVD